jgi:hypothetical protein
MEDEWEMMHYSEAELSDDVKSPTIYILISGMEKATTPFKITITASMEYIPDANAKKMTSRAFPPSAYDTKLFI